MRAGRFLHATVDDARGIVLLKGYGARDLARDLGLKPLYSGVGKGWVLDAKHLPDIVAFAEWQNLVVRVKVLGGDAA
jgi:hypothetical protein